MSVRGTKSTSNLSLSLRDLAFTVSGEFEGVSREGSALIARVVREDPRFADQIADLEGMARDAGVESVVEGYEVHRRFDLLLKETWQHPSEVFDEDPEDVWYEQLLHLATRLTERAENPAKYLEIERRLESAYAVYRAGEEVFKCLAERLDELDLDVAERTLYRFAHRLQRRRETTTHPATHAGGGSIRWLYDQRMRQ